MKKFTRLLLLVLIFITAYLFIFDRSNPLFSLLAIILIFLSLLFNYLF